MTMTSLAAEFLDTTMSYNFTSASPLPAFVTSANFSMTTELESMTKASGAAGGSSIRQFPLFWVAYYINIYYLWFIFGFGFPGNLACLITILRMPPLTSSTTYVAALAITDNFAIVNKLMFHQFTLHNVDIGAGGCKTLFYLGSFSAMLSNWILVAMTIERFVAIWFPLNVSTICTKRNTFITLSVLALSLMLANFWFLFSATAFQDAMHGFDCGIFPEYSHFYRYYWYWIDGLLYAILPSIILVIFNVLIIKGIRRSARAQKDLTNNKNDVMAEKFRQQRQITIMLVAVSMTFVVLNLPNCLFFIVKPYWKSQPNSIGFVRRLLTEQFIFLLSDVNNAINFYMYFLSARKFRIRFVQIITCRKAKQQRSFTTLTRTGHTNINVSNTSLCTSNSAGNVHLGTTAPGIYTVTNNNAKSTSSF